MGSDVYSLAVNPLTLELRHPSPSLLAFSRMEVGIEHSEERAVTVEHLIGLHVGMVDGDVLVLFERDAVEAVGQSEHTVYHF